MDFEKIDGKITKREGKLLQKLGKKACSGIIEIGPWKGKSTCYLASKSSVHIYTIDLFTGTDGTENTLKPFLKNIKNYKYIKWFKGKSSNMVNKFEDDSYDLIFIDGNHTFKFVMEDYKNYYPKIVNGGIMAFHDSLFHQDINHIMIQEIYLSNKFKNIGWIDSITYATKTNNMSIWDKIKNRIGLVSRIIYIWIGFLYVLIRCSLKLKS